MVELKSTNLSGSFDDADCIGEQVAKKPRTRLIFLGRCSCIIWAVKTRWQFSFCF